MTSFRYTFFTFVTTIPNLQYALVNSITFSPMKLVLKKPKSVRHTQGTWASSPREVRMWLYLKSKQTKPPKPECFKKMNYLLLIKLHFLLCEAVTTITPFCIGSALNDCRAGGCCSHSSIRRSWTIPRGAQEGQEAAASSSSAGHSSRT